MCPLVNKSLFSITSRLMVRSLNCIMCGFQMLKHQLVVKQGLHGFYEALGTLSRFTTEITIKYKYQICS